MADEKWLDDLKEDIIVIKETLKNMVATNDLKLIAMSERVEVLNKDIKSLEDIKMKIIALEGRLEVAEEKVKSLEDNNKWVWRSIASTILAAIMGVILIKK